MHTTVLNRFRKVFGAEIKDRIYINFSKSAFDILSLPMSLDYNHDVGCQISTRYRPSRLLDMKARRSRHEHECHNDRQTIGWSLGQSV